MTDQEFAADFIAETLPDRRLSDATLSSSLQGARSTGSLRKVLVADARQKETWQTDLNLRRFPLPTHKTRIRRTFFYCAVSKRALSGGAGSIS